MYKTSENRNRLKIGLLVKSGQGPVFRDFTVLIFSLGFPGITDEMEMNKIGLMLGTA
jgi:hypothetical protein